MIRSLSILILLGCLAWAQPLDFRRASVQGSPGGTALSPALRSTNGQLMLELPAVFRNDGTKRAYWDFPVSLDLTQMSALRLVTYCANAELVSQFQVHIRAGGVWQSASMELSKSRGWEEVTIPKTRFSSEGELGTWRSCDMLRISAWKGSHGSISLYLLNVDFQLPNISLGLVKGQGNGTPRVRTQSEKLTRNVYEALFAAGMLPAVIEESDAAFSLLAPYSMILLPYPESLGNDTLNNLLDYLNHGGKIGAFHALPPRLAAMMDLPVGKYQTLPNGSLAWLVPDTVRLVEAQPFRQNSNSIIAVNAIPLQARTVAWWTNAEGQTLRWPAILDAPTGFWMTQSFLNQDSWRAGQTFAALIGSRVPNSKQIAGATLSRRAETAAALASQEAQRKAARSLANLRTANAGGKYSAIALASFQVMNDLRNGTVRIVQGRANEIRAVWCRYSSGLPGQNWEGTISQMSGCGLNTVLTFSATPYSAAYRSRLVRQMPGEGLAECVAAAGRRGMAVHAWMNCLGVEEAPETVLANWENEGRLQRTRDGRRLNWLCPTSIENQRLLVRLATEVASQAHVYGVQFDRLRYPSSDACHCQRCRQAFANYLGLNVLPDWPRCTAERGTYRRQWLAWRASVIDQLLVQLASAALTARPRSQVSVAVYPDPRNAKEAVGQDWGKWCRSGWVSFICPMAYRSSSAVFAADVARAVEVAGRAWVVPGIGVGPSKLDAGETARQINAVRSAGVPGFAIFDLSQVVANEILPALQLR